MNITYGDKGYLIKYIQVFIHENYDSSLPITGVYDATTHKALLEYIDLPNVINNRSIVVDLLRSNISILNEDYFITNYLLESISFKFYFKKTFMEYSDTIKNYIFDTWNDFIEFEVNGANLKSRSDSMDLSNPRNSLVTWYNNLSSNNRNAFNEVCQEYIKDYVGNIISNEHSNIEKLVKQCGWYISEFTNYKNSTVEDLVITILPYNRINRFPHDKAKYMINQYNDMSYSNTCIRDGISYDDVIQSCRDGHKYKLCIIPCNGSKKFTIAHGYSAGINMYIAETSVSHNNLKKDRTIVNNTASIYLEPGNYYIYETRESTKTLLVQIPDINEDSIDVSTKFLSGDLNFDGKINIEDLGIFDSYWAYNLLIERYNGRNNLINYIRRSISSNKIREIDLHAVGRNQYNLDTDIIRKVSYDNNNNIVYTPIINAININKLYEVDFETAGVNLNITGVGYRRYIFHMKYIFDDLTKEDYIKLVSYKYSDSSSNYSEFTEILVNGNKIHIDEKFKLVAKIIWDNSNKIIYTSSRGQIAGAITTGARIRNTNGSSRISYEYKINDPTARNKLLVLDTTSVENNDVDSINIPFREFTNNQWTLHEKLISYILGITINKYSDESDIMYLRRALYQGNEDKIDIKVCEYDDNLSNIVKDIQKSYSLSFITGDLDPETESILRRTR